MPFSEEQRKDFQEKAKPLIKWINENADPHTSIIIDNTHAEVLSGEIAFRTEEFWRD